MDHLHQRHLKLPLSIIYPHWELLLSSPEFPGAPEGGVWTEQGERTGGMSSARNLGAEEVAAAGIPCGGLAG